MVATTVGLLEESVFAESESESDVAGAPELFQAESS